MSAPLTVPLTDARAADPAFSGGKGAGLAMMARAGLPVPDGMVISTAAYRAFVRDNALTPLIDRARAATDLHTASTTLRRAFEEAPIPPRLREAIVQAYRGGPVAVRSSATAEDLPRASFAGQQETVLDVEGEDALCDAVRHCWSSLWTARAMSYRRDQEIGDEHLSMAVVVQRMVPASVAGVLFTADPLSGRRDHMMIEAAPGLGDAVVGGRVTPARLRVDGSTGMVLGEAPRLLPPDRLDMLIRLGSRVARLFGSPQDVEWALDGDAIWLLQSRPITSLFPLPPPTPGLRVYLPALLLGQGIPEPLTPAGTAFFRGMTHPLAPYFSPRSRPGPDGWLPVIAGRLFLDVTPVLSRPRLARRFASLLGLRDPATAAATREWLSRNAPRLPRARGPLLRPITLRRVGGVLGETAVALAAPGRARRRILKRASRRVEWLERRAATLSSPAAQLEFVERFLPGRAFALAMDEIALPYAELLVRAAAERLVRRWLGPAADFEPVRRWLSHDPTVAMGTRLARLAAHYAATGTGPTPSDPPIREFLAVYGHRAPDREIDPGLPRLAEDPSYVIDLIRGYLRSPASLPARPESGAAQARAAADHLVAAVRRAKGPLRALLLRSLLGRHRELGGMRERPKFDLVRVIALARRTLRRAGTTLAAQGVLDDPDDVFFLDPADLRTMSARGLDVRGLVAANREEYRRELRRRAVPRLLVSDGETVYGPAAAMGGMVGTPVSPGVYEGVARVLDSPVGATLQPGEILVATSTDPGWTPLFLLAGALVMEVGGVISHGAVVAREYGIPAVAGIFEATTRLRTGQRIRVDGTSGAVTVLDGQ